MADIRKVLGKGKEYDIEGVTVSLKPLRVKNMDVITALQSKDKKEKDKAILDFMMLYLEQAFPDSSEEERGDVKFPFVNKLIECAMDVNGLSQEDVEKAESVADGNKE